MNYVFEQLKHLIPEACHVKIRENGDMLIVANDDSDIIYLNETAKDFYLLFNGHLSIEKAVEKMKEIYSIEQSQEPAFIDDMVLAIRDMQWNHIIKLKELTENETI